MQSPNPSSMPSAPQESEPRAWRSVPEFLKATLEARKAELNAAGVDVFTNTSVTGEPVVSPTIAKIDVGNAPINAPPLYEPPVPTAEPVPTSSHTNTSVHNIIHAAEAADSHEYALPGDVAPNLEAAQTDDALNAEAIRANLARIHYGIDTKPRTPDV